MKETRFKDTEIGRIPEDWDVKTFDSLFSVIRNGFGYNARNTKGYPMSRIETMSKGFINYELVGYSIVEPIAYKMQYGDILFSHINSLSYIGKVAYYKAEKPLYHGMNVLLLRTNVSCDNKYIYYQLASRKLKQTFETIAKPAINQASISTSDIKDVLCPIPHIQEQNKIASALTCIDNLISSLDKLIEKKKNIKQGTMQQLFTGKKRLKGFTEPWAEKQLGKIGSTFSGLTGKTKEDFGTGNAKYITFLNVLNNPILKSELFEDVVVREGEKQNSCHKGDLFFNTSSETPEEVGICAMLNTEQDSLYLNSFCFGYRLNDENIVPEYLAYYFRSNEGRKLMTVLAQGVTRYNMSKSAFNNAKIMMPTTSMEQQAIAEVLKSMDKEIESIEIKKTKYESIKQGMMQQLLTGKIRLI